MRGEGLEAKQSIFSWSRRYYKTDKRDPREDMLTQVFAGVLDNVNELPSWLLQELLREPLGVSAGWEKDAADMEAALASFSGSPSLKTQVKVVSGGDLVGFIDLAIEFGEDILIWIESKHGSKLSHNQLRKYSEVLNRKQPRHKVLLLIAPTGFDRDQDLPNASAESSWGLVGSNLKKWIEEVGPAKKEDDRWLVGQFNTYMREEHLLNDDPLEMEDIKIGREIQGVKQKVDQFLVDVDRHINHWSEGTSWIVSGPDKTNLNSNWPGRLRRFQANTQLDDVFGGGYWLEWRIREDPQNEASDPYSTLAAGIGFGRGAEAAVNPKRIRERLDQQTDPNLEIYPDFSNCAWVIDSINLWKLLDDIRSETKDYDQQVKQAADWVTRRMETAVLFCSSGEFD